MRSIILAFLLILALGTAQAVPLQGSDGNSTVVLFGASRTPLDDENATHEILKVDVGLMGAENATYQLIDADNIIYSAGLYKQLSSGRQTIWFLTSNDRLMKLINVTPNGGAPIYINWWATPKASNENLIIRYYGITDWLVNSDEQAIVIQVRVQNNGTRDLLVSPENFTLLDQWGWPYQPTLGFDPEVVAPQNATAERVKLGFTGVSLLSRPAALAYDYMTANQIIINFDKDYVPLSDEVVYGSNSTKSQAPAQPQPAVATSDTDQTAAAQTSESEAAQDSVKENATTKIGTSIKDKIAASKARLAATKESLDQKTPDTSGNASISSDSTNSTSSISA